MKRISLTVAVTLCVAGASPLLGGPPDLMRYQARLTDDAGVPLTGQHDLVFSIFDAGTGGNQCWSETHGALNVTNGSVDLLLGGITPLASSVFTDDDPVCSGSERWLEILVDAVPLSPRQRLASVPFAYSSDRLGDRTVAEVLDRSNQTGTQPPSSISPQGSGSGLDADLLDGLDSTELTRVSLGMLESRSVGTVYQAGTDGFVVAFFQVGTSGPADGCGLLGYTGPTDPPGNLVTKATNHCFQNQWGNVFFPVRSGEYYRVVIQGSVSSSVMNFMALSG